MIFLIASSVSCKGQYSNMGDTPLVTVIKLQSAEALLNFEEAKKYIDLEKVFEENPESNDVEKEWKEMLTFFHNIGKDKKFTNQLKYFNYDIREEIKGNKAEVSFAAYNKEAHIKEIIYSLDKLKDRWRVIDIQHVN